MVSPLFNELPLAATMNCNGEGALAGFTGEIFPPLPETDCAFKLYPYIDYINNLM